MLVEEQIQARQKRAKQAVKRILKRPPTPFGDYVVLSTSGKQYRVAMRGPGLFDNFCTCPDFARNTLGTCKHIENILTRLRNRYRSKLMRHRVERERASLSLVYGDTLEVQLNLPVNPDSALTGIRANHFDSSGFLRRDRYKQFGRIMGELRRSDGAAVIYSDVLDHVDRVNELAEGLAWERRQLRKVASGKPVLQNLLKVPLFPYQVEGVLFAASRGRIVLADDMGLGKTVQTIAAAALLRKRRGIGRVLVISPASVKYQWKTEIERFSDLSVQVIDGRRTRRQKLYASPTFFNLINYELIRHDMELIRDLGPDLIVLDEAQRIRNWTTKTARTVKQLKSRYAFVLTGTPLENKLEELYSVVEFVDGRVLGPAFRFLHDHVQTTETGKLIGYQGLRQIHKQLEPILIRRRRDEVLKQLPERTDQTFLVPLTEQQAAPYWEQNEILGRLIHKWNRQGWLSEVDMRRITCCLQNMRMLCNSTFLFDKETNFSPKLVEFREIIRELTLEERRKVVVFSEYQRMTMLAAQELDELGIGYVSLHGGVPTPKRGDLMARFREDPDCMVFLSTDAGGVGLNLQSASAVINFEPPWNPARLEQRIGRVHRMGQSRPVQVIHLLTEGSIEERVWQTMRLKRALFSGLFDMTADEVSFEKLGRSTMMKVVKEVVDDTPRPSPAIEEEPEPEPVPLEEDIVPDTSGREEPAVLGVGGGGQAGTPSVPGTTGPPVSVPGAQPPVPAPAPVPPSAPAPAPATFEGAVAGLFEAGLRFLEAFAPQVSAPPAGQAAQQVSGQRRHGSSQSGVASLIKKDPDSGSRVVAIPLPETVDAERIEQAVGGLLRRLSGGG